MTQTNEAAFEIVIESHLLANSYVAVDRDRYDAARAVFPEIALTFIRETQPKEWAKLKQHHGADLKERFLNVSRRRSDDAARGTTHPGACDHT